MAQDPVQRAQTRSELGPGSRRHRQLDQRIHRGITDPHPVAGPLGIRRLGAEPIEQLRTRRLAPRDADREQIEIEDVQPLLDQREIGAAVLGLDAEPAERLEPGRERLRAVCEVG